MGTTSEKLSYLNTTKEKIRDSINLTGANLTSEDTFRSYASKLKQGYIDIINNGIDTLYNNFPKVSGIGSNLSLTPTYEVPMKLNEIQGDTLQDGSPTPDTPVPIQSVTGLQNVNVCGKNIYNATLTEHTKNNLTYSADTTKLYFSGTSNAESKIDYGGTLLKAGTYTLNLKRISLNRNASFFIYKYGTWTPVHSDVIRLSDTIEKTSLTFTLSEDTNIMLSMYYGNNLVFNNCSVEYQIVPGSSTDYNFEPYKGNTYEVNLGKNLLNANQESYTFTAGVNSGQPIIGTINLKANTKYYVSYTIDAQMTSNTRSTPFLFLGNNKYYQYETTNVNLTTGRKVWEYTPTTSGTYSFGYWSHTPDVDLTVSKFMISKSSDTSYSPYFTPIELNKIGDYQDSIKKSTGKNLFDKDNTNKLDGYINSAGTITSETTNKTIYIPCKSNTTYTVSKIASTRFGIASYSTTPQIGSTTSNFIRDNSATHLTLTTGSSDTYLAVWYYNSNTDTLTEQQILDSFQIEENNQATDYEPYGKVWYVEKNIGKYTFDGSEYVPTSTLNDYQWFRFNLSGVAKGSTFVCSHLTNYTLIGNYIGISNSGTADRIYFSLGSNITTTNEAKNWLSTNKPETLYQLDTPEITEITNTELIEDLETLYTAKSQDGTTNISITSEDLEMILNVSALKGDVE